MKKQATEQNLNKSDIWGENVIQSIAVSFYGAKKLKSQISLKCAGKTVPGSALLPSSNRWSQDALNSLIRESRRTEVTFGRMFDTWSR